MSVSLNSADFKALEDALTALITANRQSNSKSAELKTWFEEKANSLVAVSYITEGKQIGNRLKEQRAKLAPYTLLFSEDNDISDRALARIAQYVYPNLRAVFFFVRPGKAYRLRAVARGKMADNLTDQIVAHYRVLGKVHEESLPDPQVVTWSGEAASGSPPGLPVQENFEPLESAHPILASVRAAKADGYAGVILTGPPGTGKSHYAARIALTLADGAESQVRFVQFHPSYQYEDFIQGYVPNGQTFEPRWKVFGQFCIDAAEATAKLLPHVLVIDEFSRTDAARVFGEALTYIETDKRGKVFTLASGATMSIPPNIFIIATMNPWDRGVDDLDVALERRFAEIAVRPSLDGLTAVLDDSQLTQPVREGLSKFFEAVQALENQYCHIGHAYFRHARDNESLLRLWDFRLRPFFVRACRADKGQLQKVDNMWRTLVFEAAQRPEVAAGEDEA